MSENKIRVKTIVEDCLKKIVGTYRKREHKEDFLTESDVVCSLFCMLKNEMKYRSIKEFRVHSELRPYREGMILKARNSSAMDWEWKEYEPNSGSVADIVIINGNQKYFELAEKLCPKNYWRITTYACMHNIFCTRYFHRCFTILASLQ